MIDDTVAFIGGGNMTRAIAGGLLEDGFDAAAISIAEPLPAQRNALTQDLPGVFVTDNNAEAVGRADCVVLAVKPQVLAGVCRELAETVQTQRPLIVSIAAGPRVHDIDTWLGGNHAIVRVMPNQPALLRAGISGIYANDTTTPEQMNSAVKIMSAVGPVIELAREEDIDTVTAVSGSGPAYFYLLMDMLADIGTALGLERHDAHQLAVATAAGAAELAKATSEPMHELIARVRSPGGTTAAALDSLDADEVRDIFRRALTAARDRAVTLADLAHESGKESE